jgi:predicted nucleic acid-binding Zn ribbon protein
MPANTTTLKHCLACDKPLHGRSDKKFCNDYCRNAYNNSMKSMNNTVVRNINTVLTKNRKILDGVLGDEKTIKTNKEKLLRQGFDFKYITHSYTNKNGDTYCFCYEMGYLPLEKDWYLVVRRKEENSN